MEAKRELMLSVWDFISGYMNRQITMNALMAQVQMVRDFQDFFSSWRISVIPAHLLSRKNEGRSLPDPVQ